MTLDPALVNLADGVTRALAYKVLPNALDAAAAIVEPMLIAELPDSDLTGSRDLQTKDSRRIWNTKMKRETGIKRFRPRRNTVLRIVGVKPEAAHARFDHGDKALQGEGRIHKLAMWGPNRYAKVNPRKQRYDIAKVVQVKVMPAVVAVVKTHLESAVANGELLKP